MLTMAVAASAFAACNKQETTPVGTNYKSVEFSLENVNFTKATTNQIIGANDAVNLKSFQVFFADATGTIYHAKEADNSTMANEYFTAADLDKNLIFHFLDPKVTQVVVVGNLPENTTAKTIFDLEQTLAIADQQDRHEAASELTLYAQKALTLKTPFTEHKGTTDYPHKVDIYEAEVTLLPRVARIEIVGYECNFSDPALYDQVTIDQIAIDGYNSTASLATGAGATLVNAVNPANQVDLFNYFKANADATTPAWWFDETAINLTPEAETAAAPLLAYHVFPSAVPELLIDITTTKVTGEGEEAVEIEMPAYLYTDGFATSADAITPNLTGLDAGKVYRLTLAFDDTDLTQQDKCVEVKVQVVNWVVVPVYPIF